MQTLLAAATLAACIGGAGSPCDGYVRINPPFAPAIYNGLLVTPPPEDFSRVYTPGLSEFSGRLWLGDDARDVRARRTWHPNPGKLAYGAAAADCECVAVRVNTLEVPISPWQRVEGEGLENFERARQQWLAERGYTGGVRTFVSPARARAILQQIEAAEPMPEAAGKALPEPSATIRLRNPEQKRGVHRQVDAGVAGGVQIVAGDEPVRISWPMGASPEAVERSAARGWTESEESESRVADARK